MRYCALRFLSNSSMPPDSGSEEGGLSVSAPDPRPCVSKEPPRSAGYALGWTVIGTYISIIRIGILLRTLMFGGCA